MAARSDHWRDLHRVAGKFKARPGARVIKDPNAPEKDEPVTDQSSDSRPPKKFDLARLAEKCSTHKK